MLRDAQGANTSRRNADVLDLRRANLRTLELEGSYTRGLSADGLNVERDVLLRSGFKSEGEVWLRAATIGGNLECDDSQFLNRDGWALLAEGTKIGSSVLLRNGFRAEGAISFLNSTIIGSFECSGGSLLNEKGVTLNLRNATVGGDLFFNSGFTSSGEVLLNGATIKGIADFSGGIFTSKEGDRWAINADSVVVEKYIDFGQGFQSDGVVWLRAAQIAGILEVWGANFSAPDRVALNLTYAKIGTLHIYQGTKINGRIALEAATIDTSLCWEDLDHPELAIGIYETPKSRRSQRSEKAGRLSATCRYLV
jgi:hypothetical protein